MLQPLGGDTGFSQANGPDARPWSDPPQPTRATSSSTAAKAPATSPTVTRVRLIALEIAVAVAGPTVVIRVAVPAVVLRNAIAGLRCGLGSRLWGRPRGGLGSVLRGRFRRLGGRCVRRDLVSTRRYRKPRGA